MSKNTIYALSSGALPSGVAIIRVSGPLVKRVMSVVLHRELTPREAVLCKFVSPESDVKLDEGVAVYFAKPHSFTGEDVLELQCHGGVATVASILAALGSIAGLRAAERGEFSRRAFENGRLDLTELEGLSDLIAAQTESQRKLALSQSGGVLRALYDGWRVKLIKARALIEAELDFSDEDDVPDSVSEQVWATTRELHRDINSHLTDGHKGELVRRGFRIALLGPTNAGKSSLLNALAKRDVAIVTPQAGTTRDTIEISLDIAGHLVVVVDTAGFRHVNDLVEIEGMRRSKEAAKHADLTFWLQPFDSEELPNPSLGAVVVRTKSDLVQGHVKTDELYINTVEKSGIEPLLSWLEHKLSALINIGDEPVLTRQRHRDALTSASKNLETALNPRELEIRSEFLRLAAEDLGRITGRIDVEDLLDVIFSEFCVGK